MATIRDRVRELRRVRAGDLRPNPAQWRTHGDAQRRALQGVISEIGFAGAALAYEQDGQLILADGHLRSSLDPNAVIPVLVLDLDAEEAKKLLATYDPLGAMAGQDQDALLALLRDVSFQDQAVNDLLEAIANGERVPMPPLWEPAVDTTTGEHAEDLVGYDLGSVWWKTEDADRNTRLWPYVLSLPHEPTHGAGRLTNQYSRSPLLEMENIVRTYMELGDRFLEVCAGWWTFSATAACWGYDGTGIDIWDVSIDFAAKQLAKLPEGCGKVTVISGDATAMPFEDAEFDFVYCNAPFFHLEAYGGGEKDIGAKSTLEEWLSVSGMMMQEMCRVVKPGGLICTIMADYRKEGILVPLGAKWIELGLHNGFILHDLAVQRLLSQQLRMWRHAFNAKRTAKAHEYIVVFRKPGVIPKRAMPLEIIEITDGPDVEAG